MTRIILPREPLDPVNVVRNPKVAAEWRKQFLACWLCGETSHHHEVHHIVGGAHRSDERCNFAFLCSTCHAFVETMEPLSSVRLCMYLKKRLNSSHYDKPRIEALFGRRLDQ